MYTTWILVANRTQARLFENRSPGRELTLTATFEHPSGDLKNRELKSDRPGRSRSKTGLPKHALSQAHDAHEREAMAFAEILADKLEIGRRTNQCQKVVLVAEPKFLGILHGALAKATAELVHADVTKDLGAVADRDILGYLGDLNGLWEDVNRVENLVYSSRMARR